MSHITSMIETHPNDASGIDVQKLADCIAACLECAQTCTSCADACLAEEMVADLRNCIRLNLDCAQASIRVQATRSAAIITATSQAWFKANSREGSLPRPVSLAWRIRSSTRA